MLEAVPEGENGIVSRPARSLKGRISAVLGAVLSLVLLAALGFCTSANGTGSKSSFVQSLGAFRVTPGRIPGLAHAPFPTPPRNFQGARRRTLVKARRDGRSASLIDLALGRSLQEVLQGETAVDSMQDPENACLLSALFLGLAAEGDKPLRHASRALTWAEAALRHRPSLPEGHFNRALAFERLSLFEDANSAWIEYLKMADKSPWAEEARSRRRQLATRIPHEKLWANARRELENASHSRAVEVVSKFAQPSRLWVERNLLKGWARSHLERGLPERTARWLDRALAVSKALSQATRDSLDQEAALAIKLATDGGDTSRLAKLAEGHLALIEGIELHEAMTGCHAEDELFRLSEVKLRAAESPMALWATFYRANCSFRQRDFNQARSGLLEISRHCRTGRYRTLCGRSQWLEGLMAFHQNRLGDAQAAYARAHDLLLMERPFLAAVLFFQSEVFMLWGEHDRAWEFLDQSLAHLETLPPSERMRRQVILQGVARLATLEGDFPTALHFEASALKIAKASAGSLDDALILRERAAIHHQAGKLFEAAADLDQAQSLLQGTKGTPERSLSAEIQVIREELFPADHSVADWTVQLNTLEETNHHFLLPQALFLLGRASIREGNPRGAETAWRRGLRELNQFQPSLGGRQKSNFFERRDAFLAELLPVQVQLDPLGRRAFRTVERSRRRSSLGLLSQEDISIEDLQRALAPRNVLLEYAVVPDRLLIWVIAKDRSLLRSAPIALPQLSPLLDRIQEAKEEELLTILSQLYEVLFKPVQDDIPVGSTLLIVPDWRLYAVPFAALRDTQRGRFLGDDFLLTSLPDARSILRIGLRESRLASSVRSLLALGDPAFPHQQHPGLARIPKAAEEAEAIWSLYDSDFSRLRLGEQATPSEFLQGLGRYEVVHYGGHAAATSPDPALARLVLAPEVGRSSDLSAHEFYGRSFSGTRLVVLAACETAAAKAWISRAGLEGFIEPLLEGGVRNVIASLWAVDDEAAQQQAIAFHLELRRTGKPLESLAGVQRSWRQRGEPVRRWAAFAAFGPGP